MLEDIPITSVTAYHRERSLCDQLLRKWHTLNSQLDEEEDEDKIEALLEELTIIGQEEDVCRRTLSRCLPSTLVAQCPFCEAPVWMRVGVFSLSEDFWYHIYSDGKEGIYKELMCAHLFCVDGALNLNGHQPIDAYVPPTIVTNDKITIAAEVPFVKPRVLNLPTMVAVIHSFPIAEKYTAFPVVYFAQKQPEQSEFCVGWARTEYVAQFSEKGAAGSRVVLTGKRSDAQDYELEKWIRQGKLAWLSLNEDISSIVHGPVNTFPYFDIPGRQHPYSIKNGIVHNLQNPSTDSKPDIHLEF